MIYMVFPQGKRKALTLSYDDGVEQDIRLVEIMRSHGLLGTFNLNSGLYAQEGTTYAPGTIHRRMTRDAVTKLFADSGMEVALHGYRHGFLTQQTDANGAWEIVKDRETMEAQFDRIVRGFAYPFGAFDDRVVAMLRSCGVVYARTTISSHHFKLPADWLRLEATCHHKDPELMNLARQFKEETPKTTPWLFYLWGHSYEFEAMDNWQVIEDFAAYIGGDETIWYATNMQIHDYVEAWKQLVSSADGRRYSNPTATTLWLRDGENVYEILPGSEIILNR